MPERYPLGVPPKQGLYDPRFEHDACGVGMVCHMKGEKSHQIIADGLQILVNLTHRGACGCDETTGDGAGILIQTPDRFLREKAAAAGLPLAPGDRLAAGRWGGLGAAPVAGPGPAAGGLSRPA